MGSLIAFLKREGNYKYRGVPLNVFVSLDVTSITNAVTKDHSWTVTFD